MEEEKQKEEKKDRTTIAYILVVVVVIGLALLVIFVDRENVGLGNILQPKEEEPPKTKVVMDCIRTNNTPCVIDGTCPRYEQHTFKIEDTDYLDGEFFWYNNSWCEVEWR